MPEDERLQAIKHLLFNYVRSPSLRHIRDPHAVIVLANEIMRVVDGRNSAWLKWDEQRENLMKSAVGCWIPFDDLRDFLNGLPGPALTTTDVSQRMRAFEDEDYFSYPKEALQPGCLAIYDLRKPAELSCRPLSGSCATTSNARKSASGPSKDNNMSNGAKRTGSTGSSDSCPVPIASGRS
jgi:hypothetical protein